MSVAKKLFFLWAMTALVACGARPAGNLLAQRRPDVMTFMTHGERLTDGISAPNGAAWDVEQAAILQSGGSAEWDLGQVQRFGRAFIQADNDDRYAVLVSSDRKAWRVLWEAEPLKSGGLSTRTADELTGEGRYVRLEPRGGDGHYSVTELVLAPPGTTPWPPLLAERLGVPEDPRQPPLGRAMVLAALLGALVLFFPWGAPRTRPFLRQPLVWIASGLSLFLVVTAMGYALAHRHNLVDDAYISLQYAKNWASGQGLVFNPGEKVEGYTNFLWVAVLAPLWPLSGHDPTAMARASTWLAIVLAVIGVGLVAAVGRRVFPRSVLPAAFAVLLLAFDDAFLSYTVVFALENHLLCACMLAGLALVVYRPRRWELGLGTTFALVGMTRPDGLLWGGTFLLVYALPVLLRRRTDGPDLRALVKVAASFAIIFGVYFLIRWRYFGDLLPNTFHLKVGSSFAGFPRGFDYLRSYLTQRSGLPLVGLLAVFFTRATWTRWLALHIVLHALYVAYVGGDFYSGHRFLMALTPSLALLAGAVLDWALALERGPVFRATVLGAALAGCLAVRWGTLRYGPYTTELYGWGVIADNNIEYMRWMKDAARPRSSMVVGDIGATGFFSDIEVVDVFGVVDHEVARKVVPKFGTGKPGHEKVATREEQLARHATYIKWGYVDDGRAPPGYYIFNDFPLHLRVEGLWVLDDLAHGQALPERSFHMNAAELAGWSHTGDAFATALPALGPRKGQSYVNGQQGSFIDTFLPGLGDGATGRLVSPDFPLEGDRLRLLVGGGRDPERLRVSLVIGGKRVFSETGSNWETLGRREWNIAPLRGQTAHLEIVDEATGAWGHLLVDEIEQWSGTPNLTGKL
jgi:hypothetical protein